MITSTAYAIIRILLVILILGGMSVILVGISRLTEGESGREQKEATDKLRREVRNEHRAISRHSLLYRFLVRGNDR